MSKPKILVLLGADSPEREVSIWSGTSVKKGLEKAGYHVTTYDPIGGDEGLELAVKLVDVVLPILHGIGGEDGVIQAKLEKLGAKFLGSSSSVSELAFDKVKTHEILEKNGIRMPKYAVVSDTKNDLFKEPFALKPIAGGSSVDTLIVREVTEENICQAKDLINKYQKMIVEKLVNGQEITVPILGNEILSVMVAIPPEDEEFNYNNKYNGKSQEYCLDNEDLVPYNKQKEAKDIALRVHEIVGARHLSRTDMFYTENGEIVVLEINTIPGLSERSFFPKAAMNAGINMSQLSSKFVELVLEDD